MWTEGYGGFEEFSQVRGGCGLWLSGYAGDGMEFYFGKMSRPVSKPLLHLTLCLVTMHFHARM